MFLKVVLFKLVQLETFLKFEKKPIKSNYDKCTTLSNLQRYV